MAMSDEQLQQIRADFDILTRKPQDQWDIMDVSNMAALAVLSVPALLAEVERLQADAQYWRDETAKVNEHRAAIINERNAAQAQNAAMREIVQAVARFDDDDSHDGAYKCHWCECSYTMGDVTGHTPDCPVTKARAVLSQPE